MSYATSILRLSFFFLSSAAYADLTFTMDLVSNGNVRGKGTYFVKGTRFAAITKMNRPGAPAGMGEARLLSTEKGNFTCIVATRSCMPGDRNEVWASWFGGTDGKVTNMSLKPMGKKGSFAGHACEYYSGTKKVEGRHAFDFENCYSRSAFDLLPEETRDIALETVKNDRGAAKKNLLLEISLGLAIKGKWRSHAQANVPAMELAHELKSIDTKSLPNSTFEIPAGYSLMRMPSAIGGGMGAAAGGGAGKFQLPKEAIEQLRGNKDIPPEMLKQMLQGQEE